MYAPKNMASKYIKQKLTDLKREIKNPTVIIRYYNICFSVIDGKRKKTAKYI